MRLDGNGGSLPNYSPNGRGAPVVADPTSTEVPEPLHGSTVRTEYPKAGRADDFEQPGLLWGVMSEAERERLVANIAFHLSRASKEIQQRQIAHFMAADREYGRRIAKLLGF